MIKFNPFTGNFDIVNPNNYSVNYVLAGATLYIPQYQQMIIRGRIAIAGRITVAGRLSVI